ncbi:MAG: prolyl oligopeptidase family serine peptidase [Pseudomonadota bacterium]
MRRCLLAAISLALLAGQANAQPDETAEETPLETAVIEDPYLWLEEVEGEDALDWVRSQNDRSLDLLQADPRFEDLQTDALDIVNADDRIPYGAIRNGQVYNFWQDETNVRGLWRRTSLESYATERPEWETVLDFDALAEAEGKNWVFKGSNCLDIKGEPVTRCLVSLSDGGKDAVINREFDLVSKSFVDGGFETPEAKQGISWVDADTILIATDWGGDGSTLTESGYPSIVKRWTRGTPLETAEALVSGDKTDVGVWPFTLELEDGRRLPGAVEADTFFTSKYFLIGEDGALRELPVPPKSSPSSIYQGQLLVALQQDWAPQEGDTEFPSGALVAFDFDTWLETGALPTVETVFQPGPRQSFEGVSRSGDTALISINDNVVGKVLRLDRTDAGWAMSPVDLPGSGQVNLAFASSRTSTAFFNYEDFLTPASLLSYNSETGEMTPLKSVPAKFDASGLTVQQFESTSTDGTKIPYFVIHREDVPLDGTTPTVLYGYGGFQVSLTPNYAPVTGKLWLEKGGAYVIANIRGGGEFGPDWHQAGLKTKRQIIYDDFISVAEDLIAKGITTPDKLGIMGGSNGGLLMGVMLNQRPDLWNAVVVQVPLLDMMRYHLLLAGASWVDEYGSPDDPEERAFLETISPYQNFSSETDYPTPFFVTSTKDDRVHPGHARKMAKLFEEGDKPFLYYENIDGGHSAAANQVERAKRVALEYTYLMQQLMDASPVADD